MLAGLQVECCTGQGRLYLEVAGDCHSKGSRNGRGGMSSSEGIILALISLCETCKAPSA